MDPLGSIWLLVYTLRITYPYWAHLVPNYHLAADPLELPQRPRGSPDPTLRTNGLQYGLTGERGNIHVRLRVETAILKESLHLSEI